MPLSEREQRILEEIESNLYKEDRRFAKEVQRKAPRMQDRRRVKLGALTFAAGFAVLIAFFITSAVVVGVAAFALMVSGIVMVAGSLLGSIAPRRPPGPGLRDRISHSIRSLEDKIKRRYGGPR